MFNSFARSCGGFLSFGRFQNGGLMMIIGLVIVIAIVYFIFKRGTFSNFEKPESPLDMLQKRFVNGEINEDEYLSKKEILRRMK